MSDRKVIPFNTGRVQIGRAYQPKPCPRQAQWIEKHKAPRRYPLSTWIAVSALGLLCLSLITWRT